MPFPMPVLDTVGGGANIVQVPTGAETFIDNDILSRIAVRDNETIKQLLSLPADLAQDVYIVLRKCLQPGRIMYWLRGVAPNERRLQAFAERDRKIHECYAAHMWQKPEFAEKTANCNRPEQEGDANAPMQRRRTWSGRHECHMEKRLFRLLLGNVCFTHAQKWTES